MGEPCLGGCYFELKSGFAGKVVGVLLSLSQVVVLPFLLWEIRGRVSPWIAGSISDSWALQNPAGCRMKDPWRW